MRVEQKNTILTGSTHLKEGQLSAATSELLSWTLLSTVLNLYEIVKKEKEKKVHYQNINVGLFYWDTAGNAALIVNVISNESCRKRVKCFVHL